MNRDDDAIEKIKAVHLRSLTSTEAESDAWSIEKVPLEFRDPARWPTADMGGLSVKHQDRFERYSKAMRGFFAHGNLTAAAREAGVVPSTFLFALKRCLSDDGRCGIVGWPALLWNRRITPFERTAGAPPKGGRDAGTAGAFRAFLKSHAKLKAELDEFILPTDKGGAPRSARPSKGRAFSRFKELCEKHGVQANEYPLTNKSKGRRSVERYVDELMQARPEAAAAFYFGEAASRRMKLGTGRKSDGFRPKLLRNATIDAHRFDCHCTIELDGPAGPQPVLITRLWLITVIDDGRCVMGFAVSLREEVSAADVERAILSATTPWQPGELKIKGLQYVEGAGLPYGVVEGLPPFAPACIRMDNAAVHYSNRILENARRVLGCAITFIPVSAWWRNAIHERWHRQLESLGIQRITSSAGNSPTDALKGDGMANALKHGVRLAHIEEIAGVLIANSNATPTEALGNRSPLDALRYGIASGEVLPRQRPTGHSLAPELGVTTVKRIVRGRQKTGQRPYVEIDKVRYTGGELSDRFDLIGTCLRLHIKDRDMRFVEAYTEAGTWLGTLEASGAWRHRVHTREQRKAINQLKDIGAISSDVGGDVVEAYHDHLVELAKTAAVKAPEKINRPATVAARVGRDVGAPTLKPKPVKAPVQASRAPKLNMPAHMNDEVDYGVF